MDEYNFWKDRLSIGTMDLILSNGSRFVNQYLIKDLSWVKKELDWKTVFNNMSGLEIPLLGNRKKIQDMIIFVKSKTNSLLLLLQYYYALVLGW